MADAPIVATRRLTRDQLATFLKSHELIKAFENMAKDVSETLPEAVGVVSDVAEQSLVTMLLTQDARASQIRSMQQKIDELTAIIQSLRAANTQDLQRQIDELRSIVLGG